MLSLGRQVFRKISVSVARARFAKRQTEVAKDLARFSRPCRLNLGCGKARFDGWINIDLGNDGALPDVVWNLTDSLPMEDESCDLIYSEHVLEHLKVEDGNTFLRDCRRLLRPTGILRIAMPSLDSILTKCCTGQWKEQDWLKWPEFQFVQTRAEMLNMCFRWWGHQWLYDWEELDRRLKDAGFTSVQEVCWGESLVPELRNRETRKDSLLICEARK